MIFRGTHTNSESQRLDPEIGLRLLVQCALHFSNSKCKQTPMMGGSFAVVERCEAGRVEGKVILQHMESKGGDRCPGGRV